MDLSDITIVILSRGREEILLRTLKYWSKINIAVLVLHNTENPFKTHELGSNITYVVEKVTYAERCGLVSKYLNTEYAILSSDDELYIPSAMRDMKNFLTSETSIFSVGGLTLAVAKYGPRHTAIACYSHMRSYSNLGQSSFERLSNHFNQDYGFRNGAIYRLMRKDLMIELMHIFSRLSTTTTPYIYEVTGEIIVNGFGKSVYLPNIYWIRNWINKPVVHQTWDRKFYFSTWASDPEYREEFQIWSDWIKNTVKLTEVEYLKILPTILESRKSSEAHEQKRTSRRKIPLSDNVKFSIRKTFAPNSLPPTIEQTIITMEGQGAKLNRSELLTAIQSVT